MNTFCKQHLISMLSVMILLVTILSAVVLPAGAVAAATPDKADLNADGTVNLADANILFRYAAGLKADLTAAQQQLADFSGNSTINMANAILLYRYAAGFTSASTTQTEPTTTTTTTPAPLPSDAVQLMVSNRIVLKDNVSMSENADGSWVITSSGKGSLKLDGCGTYDAATLQYTHLGISSDVPFKLFFYDAANNKTITSEGDFFPQFNASAGQAAPAGNYNLALYTKNCYTWDGSALPAVVQLSSIRIELEQAGTLTLSTMCLSKSDVPEAMTKILFVGNSFVFYNDMPSTLKTMFAASGEDIYVDSVTQGGAYLSYYADPDNALGITLRQKLTQTHWDYIVLQDQSSHPADDPQNFLNAAATICKLIDNNTKILFYQTWAYRDGSSLLTSSGMTYDEMYAALRSAYMTAAQQNGGRCVPVGDSFRAMKSTYPEVTMYAADDLHPSVTGSYLIAATYFREVTGSLPAATLPLPSGVSAENAQKVLSVLQTITD